jgi:hypothetical protein
MAGRTATFGPEVRRPIGDLKANKPIVEIYAKFDESGTMRPNCHASGQREPLPT